LSLKDSETTYSQSAAAIAPPRHCERSEAIHLLNANGPEQKGKKTSFLKKRSKKLLAASRRVGP
jgi:hypothetical protein